MEQQPRVGVVLSSSSDEEPVKSTVVMLEKFGVSYEVTVMNPARSPLRVATYASEAEDRGLQVLIGAGGRAALLPGMLAASTIVPVIGLPLWGSHLCGQDAVFSMLQMPAGVPVATVGLDAAVNAGILAVQILAATDAELRERLREFKQQLDQGVRV